MLFFTPWWSGSSAELSSEELVDRLGLEKKNVPELDFRRSKGGTSISGPIIPCKSLGGYARVKEVVLDSGTLMT